MPRPLPDDHVVIRPIPDWWPEIHPFLRRCTPRVLVVTDGLTFGGADFGLDVFLSELGKALPAPVVTTKIHGPWTFDATVTAANYDELWLFGVGATPLPDAEVQVIAAFMEAGGGVFATGDHETLGYGLCGELPRVRKMRDWATVPMASTGRIDTVSNPGPDRLTQFDDQSDDLPQRIFPTYYGSGSSWWVHSVLRSPLGDIDVLPDHPHESVCLAGYDLGDDYVAHGLHLDEFPNDGAKPLAPEIVAWSVSAGRYLNPPGTITGKPPTTPKLFGAISTWDGHRVQRGRIVCDATWHHFINVNLVGTGAVPAPGNSRDGLRRPATAGGPPTFTDDFHQVAQYFRNVMDWLIPAHRRWCRWWIDLLVERYTFPLFEELRRLPEPHPCPWEPRVALGADVEAALERTSGPGAAEPLVTAALEAAGLEEMAGHVRPLAGDDDRHRERMGTLLDVTELRRGVLGSVADALLRDLPPTPDQLAEHLRDGHDDAEIERTVAAATGEAWEAARDHYRQAIKATRELISD
jgi:hypothetical protein